MNSGVVVLVHGHIMDASCPSPWEVVVLGDTVTRRLGRVSTALKLVEGLKNYNVPFGLVIGTGATNDVIKAADASARKRLRQASGNTYRDRVMSFVESGSSEALSLEKTITRSLLEGARWDVDSMSTADEILVGLAECKQRKADALLLVSSPEHIARCHQTAIRPCEAAGVQVLAMAAATGFYEPGTPINTCILEGVHGTHDADHGLAPHLQRDSLAKTLFFGGAFKNNPQYRQDLLDVTKVWNDRR